MNLMLGLPQSFEQRKQLREELGDYLLERIGEQWMVELMGTCQELDGDDVALCATTAVAAPTGPAAADAAAPHPPEEEGGRVPIDEETLMALRWASGLEDDTNVLALIRSLPQKIVEEQVHSYRKRAETAVAARNQTQGKIRIHRIPTYQQRMCVAKRFHGYCRELGIDVDNRMPHKAVDTFVKENLAWATPKQPTAKQIRNWYARWRQSPTNLTAAVAATPTSSVSAKSLLRSRAPKPACFRTRAPGGGAKHKAPLIRQALYEWFTSIRYAIDWKSLVAENRSRGLKKNLARFPRAVLVYKVKQLLQEYAHACLMSGERAQSFKPDSWWFKRWEEDYGLSMRAANRKYQVPRQVLKERLEIFWVNLFRVRLFISLVFGYDAIIYNFDQSPFHHNETGSQNKATLGVRGSTVPVVEGNSDVRSRWTANLTTCSRFTAVAGEAMPWSEAMFKGLKGGRVHERLEAHLRSRGFPSWFTVTMGPKGSYREHDIIAFLDKHLEPWREDRDWRIILADDYSAHKTLNVFELCWSRGYILLCHGGGATPVSQTPDTDLNEHVRRSYGEKESALMMDKMRMGAVVPKLTHEECMELLLEVLVDPALHRKASEGFKKVGQSIDLHGTEDALICREAGTYWRSETTDRYPNMREKINSELTAVADEFSTGGLVWCKRDVQRLISPYPVHRKVDRILENVGSDYFRDELEDLSDAEEGDSDDDTETNNDTEGDDTSERDDINEGETAVAAADTNETAVAEGMTHALSADQAGAVHVIESTIASLEFTIESLKGMGMVRGVQCLEEEIHKQRRRERDLVRESPAVAEGFMRLRKAEAEEFLRRKRIAAQLNQRKRDAAEAIAARDAAVADMKKVRKTIQDLESTRACQMDIKTFTLEALGAGTQNAGGTKGKKTFRGAEPLGTSQSRPV